MHFLENIHITRVDQKAPAPSFEDDNLRTILDTLARQELEIAAAFEALETLADTMLAVPSDDLRELDEASTPTTVSATPVPHTFGARC